jgi:transposase InsO family protein
MKHFNDKFTALVVNQDSTSDGYYYYHNQNKEEKLPLDYLLKRLQMEQEIRKRYLNNGHKLKTKEIDSEVEDQVIKMALDNPAYGQIRVANELLKKSINISPGTVRSIWMKHGLETLEKRNLALKSLLADQSVELSEKQKEALEKAEADKSAEVEIDSLYPGYLGVQDAFSVGNVEGVGRIYQQTFIDTYSGFAIAKVYYQRNSQAAIDLLEERVIPFYQEEGIVLQRILTDRDAIYCNTKKNPVLDTFLEKNRIVHAYTDRWQLKTNGICLRFQKIVHDDFYLKGFRNKPFDSLEELQQALDEWIKEYNFVREYPGKYCFGRTPYLTIQATKQLANPDLL